MQPERIFRDKKRAVRGSPLIDINWQGWHVSAQDVLAGMALVTIFTVLAGGMVAYIVAHHNRFYPYAGTVIYASSDTTLYALKAGDGTVWWRHPIARGGIYMALPGGGVVAQVDGGIAALSSIDGTARWQFGPTADAIVQPLAVAGDTLYVAEIDSHSPLSPAHSVIVALDTHDGGEQWRLSLPQGIAATALPSNDLVLIGEVNQGTAQTTTIYGVDAQDGHLRWQTPLVGSMSVAPVSADDAAVYATVDDTVLIALDRQTGTLRWHLPLISNDIPLITYDAIYTCEAGVVHAWSARDLTPLWLANVPGAGNGGIVRLSDMLLGVFVAHGLVAFDATTGTPQWQTPILNNLGPPLAAQQIVYFNAPPDIYAMHLDNGTPLWHVDAAGDRGGALTLAQGALYLATDDTIYALDATNGKVRWHRSIPHRSHTQPAAGPDR
jgi:outer membrane protein assembly factor BamB